jgi:cell division protein FtsI (penicillin-binding protein 3)
MERPLLGAPPAPSARERRVRLRLMLVGLAICLWAVVVLLRLVQLQVFGRESFARQAARQSERTINLDPRRGPIVDRFGKQLAVSVDAESIYAVPQEVREPARTAALLARALELDAPARRELQALLQRNRAFVWVRRKVDPVKARAVRDLQLEGIGFLTENRRYYPRRELASQVLGYVGVDNTGMSGIEYAFEDMIRGKAAKVTVHIDARRRALGSIDRPSTDGHTVVLTLDERIQYVAERELEKSVAETGALAGQAIVMVPRTGEILALAHRPTFNPNRFAAYPSARWRNRAVGDASEPGSVFKMFTAAAALEEKLVDPDEVIDCGGGGIDVGGTRINDHHPYGALTFRAVIAKSSNVGAIRVAQRLGRETFNRYLREFGFGAATGVELPGESAGLLRPTSRWSALSLPSISFGQEIGVTTMQLAAAVAAVANGGYLMKPLIVRQVEDADGKVVRAVKPVAVRRVIDGATAATVTELLKGVVREGTGRRAAVPGYVVAGKTGTAQKIDAAGRYSMVDHVATFAGFVPAGQPALVVLVSLDTPRGERNEAGDVAAPLFARIAEQALRHLAVPPDDPERTLRVATYRPPVAAPATLTGGAAGARDTRLDAAPADARVMPDLRGRSAREAAIDAARRGLLVELHGSGRVFAQRPEPGTPVEPGSPCVLTLKQSAVAGPESGS